MSAQQPNNIQRTSSGSLSLSKPPPQRQKWPPEDEIISDSEEERINKKKAWKSGSCASTDEDSDVQVLSVSTTKKQRDSVIVISSDEEGDVLQPIKGLVGTGDPFVTGSTGYRLGTTPATRNKGKSRVRNPLPGIESDTHSSVIYIHDTDSDSPLPQPSTSPVKQRIVERTLTPYAPVFDPNDLNLSSDDSAILTFDPHVRSKPISATPGPRPKPKLKNPPKTKEPASAPVTPRKRKVKPEQLRLEEYARTLFAELNVLVFDNGMPTETELVWNARLATTAGRAFWSRNRFGETSSKIELSPKVVDSDERVRYTLAHEMCHLAVWVLNRDPDEQGHGPQFKEWASRVMEARPDIKISTRHTYEINFKFTWECCVCGKIYGRHSKSIDPLKMSCGVCKPPGRLKALFETRPKRTLKAASKSRLASSSPRESPRAKDRAPRSPIKLANASSAEEDEVEVLVRKLTNVDL